MQTNERKMNKQMSEQMNEWMTKRMNKRTNKKTKEQTNECMNVQTKEQTRPVLPQKAHKIICLLIVTIILHTFILQTMDYMDLFEPVSPEGKVNYKLLTYLLLVKRMIVFNSYFYFIYLRWRSMGTKFFQPIWRANMGDWTKDGLFGKEEEEGSI